LNRFSIKIKRLLILLLLLAFILVAGTVPLLQSVSGTCVIESVGMWSLMRDGVGQVVTGLEKNLIGRGGKRILRQFERPDIVELQLSSHLYNGSTVAAGDTIAVIISQEGISQLRALRKSLNKAFAERGALLAGDRTEDQEVAHQAVLRAEAALYAYKLEFDRSLELSDAGHITLSEWQAVQGQYKLLETELELSRAQHRSLQTGARPQDVAVAQAEIERLQQLIDNVKNKLDDLEAVITPLNGIVHFIDSSGVILQIERTDTMAAVIAISQAIAGRLTIGQEIEIKLFANPAAIQHSIIARIDFLGDQTGASAVVYLDNREGWMRTGMNGICKLPLGKLTLWEGIKLKLSGLVL